MTKLATVNRHGKDVNVQDGKTQKMSVNDKLENAKIMEGENNQGRAQSELTKYYMEIEKEYNERVNEFSAKLFREYSYKVAYFIATEKKHEKPMESANNMINDFARVSDGFTSIISEIGKTKKDKDSGLQVDNEKPENGIFAENDKSWFVKKESKFTPSDFIKAFKGARNYISKIKSAENAANKEREKRKKALNLLSVLGITNPTEDQINAMIAKVK